MSASAIVHPSLNDRFTTPVVQPSITIVAPRSDAGHASLGSQTPSRSVSTPGGGHPWVCARTERQDTANTITAVAAVRYNNRPVPLRFISLLLLLWMSFGPLGSHANRSGSPL